ncbi:response regulator [Clostridium sp. CF012]|uniref:response regulator transcription factor n=1 Tax=Clostridium sp. CF012 TaxID=2843319 RepID=UPI001C0B73E7|nr:response regulator [Clostridium sp. CF012]MBU3144246.1 response regulator [Clostridium sp. CF012]
METIKVLIVDDEYLERTLIKLSVDWVTNDFEIIGEANSGEAALRLMEKNPPDILITDICMPFMDGLQLCKKVREKYEHIKIIIITGHREFEYAKTAIKLGVTDFLLKPINSEEVLKIALKLKGEIKDQRKYFNEYNAMKKQLSGGLDFIKINNNKKISEPVEKIIAYIEENFTNSELSLSIISNSLFMNYSYLSRVFKQEMEESITEYITKLRINKSILYINNTNLKAYEIAGKVGINDAHYFSICFKKHTGKSINEYKNTNQKVK